MAISYSAHRQEPIHAVPMAVALLLAAFTGGTLGLVWQSTGLGSTEEGSDRQAERLVDGEEGTE